MFKFWQILLGLQFMKLGIVADGGSETDDEKALKQLGQVVEKAVSKATEELTKSYEEKISGANETIKGLTDEVSKIKAFANSSKARKEELDAKMEEAAVKVFLEVQKSGVSNEAQFEALKKEIGAKVLAEGDRNPATNSAAGFNVFEKFETDLIYEIEQLTNINAFKNITLANGTKITWTIATNGITASFVNEKGLPTASEPVFDRVSIDIKKIIALVTMTQELEEDQMTTPQLYRLIVEFGAEAVGELLESELFGGNGTNFVGIFNLPGAATFKLAATKKVTDITEADMLAIEQKINHKDRAKALWIMSDFVRYVLYALRDAAGNRLYPNLLDLNPTINGRKVLISDYGADVQSAVTNIADATFLALGNPQKYLIVHRTGVTIDKGFYGDNWAKEMPSIKIRKRGGMGSLQDNAFVIAENGD